MEFDHHVLGQMIITMASLKSADIPEQPMPYAVYRENVRISQPFATENDLWAAQFAIG
jgi:hypothetical protein